MGAHNVRDDIRIRVATLPATYGTAFAVHWPDAYTAGHLSCALR